MITTTQNRVGEAVPTEGHKDISWTPTSEFSWTEEAFRRLLDQRLKYEVRVNEEVVSTRVWGPCPRCEGQLDDRQVHSAVTVLESVWERGGLKASDRPVRIPVDITCGCGSGHLNAPEKVTGCGVSFRVELVHTKSTAAPTP